MNKKFLSANEIDVITKSAIVQEFAVTYPETVSSVALSLGEANILDLAEQLYSLHPNKWHQMAIDADELILKKIAEAEAEL